MKGTTLGNVSNKQKEEAIVRWQEITMFIVLLASYAINAMDRQIFPLIAADVRKEFGFGLADTGLLSTIFTLGMAVAGVPTGYLVARFSRKSVLQCGIAIFSAGTLVTAYASGFSTMLLYRALTGIGEAMQLTVLIAIAASYFVRYRSSAVGSINFSFGIGAIIGPLAGGMLVGTEHNWRIPLIVFGAVGFVAMAVIAVMVKKSLTETQSEARSRVAESGATTLYNRNTVILTILSVFGGLIIYGYLGMYPTYLREYLHYSPAATGGVMSFYGFGVFASIFGGWLGDRFSPKTVLGGSFIGAAALGYLLFSGPSSSVAQSALSLAWGFVISGILYVNLAGYQVKSVGAAFASRATGIFVTSLYSAGAIAGYALGWIAAHAGWSVAGLTQITAVSILGALLTMALDPESMSVPSKFKKG